MTWITKILKKIITSKEKTTPKQKTPITIPHEALIALNYGAMIERETAAEAQKAYQYVRQYVEKTQDPALKAILQEIEAEKAGKLGKFSYSITLIALAKALQKGMKDPVEILKYILAYHTAVFHKIMKEIPHTEKLASVFDTDEVLEFATEKLGIRDIYLPDNLPAFLYIIAGELEKKGLVPRGTAKRIGYILPYADNELRRGRIYMLLPDKFREARIKASKELGVDIEPYLHEIEKELGIEEEETIEHTKALAKAIAEMLPSWAIKTALDQEKAPLYTDPATNTLHTSYIKYHISRSSPEDPKGSLLHPIITHIIAQWEKQVSQGQQPSKPHEIIEKTIKEAETYKQLAATLGIPVNVTEKTLNQALNELIRDLKAMDNGQITPQLLDAEKEAAIRYYQLHLLANNKQPDPKTITLAKTGLIRILELYKKLKNTILEETQLGREEQEKILDKIEEQLPSLLAELGENLGKEPISQTVTRLTNQLRPILEGETSDRDLVAWATNLVRNLLLDAPIIAVAKNREIQGKTLEEKQRIVAALKQLYEPEARKHNIAPVSADIYTIYDTIRKAYVKGGKEAALEKLARIRSEISTTRIAIKDAHDSFKGLLSGEYLHERADSLNRNVLKEMEKIKLRIMETSITALRSKEV